MREIGGYIELDRCSRPMLHEGALALNCGRSALAYVIRARGIRRMAIPYFLCDSVSGLCAREQVAVRYYHVGADFLPEQLVPEQDEWVYLVNYYGQLTGERMAALKAQYPRLIVDQAQAYYDAPVPGADTLYTCRKYFGVPDGAFLYTDAVLEEELPLDESMDRMRFLLGRFERSAGEFYAEYAANNHLFASEPVKRMSRLTDNLLRAIDYDRTAERREGNYACLEKRLGHLNELTLRMPRAPFAYPLLVPGGVALKKALIARKIFVPTLWPNVKAEDGADACELRLVRDLLPLPCDQRYGEDDMMYMADLVEACLANPE